MPRQARKLDLKRVEYRTLNARQKEFYNFQKVSAVFAEFGFQTLWLTNDWQNADFIAVHIDGIRFLRVQLKGCLTLDQKYQGKGIWICFPWKDDWYVYPHDDALDWALSNRRLGENPKVWKQGLGAYSYKPNFGRDSFGWGPSMRASGLLLRKND